MSIEAVGVAVGILIGVGGALIKIVEVIIHQTTAAKFDEFKDESDREIKRVYRKINRVERRLAIVETQVLGDSNTFSGIEE